MIAVNLLPNDLRTTRQPPTWRVLAVVVPLLVAAAVVPLHVQAWRAAEAADAQRRTLQARIVELQPTVDALARAEARRDDLQGLADVRDALAASRIAWTDEIAALLSTLPTAGRGGAPVLDFDSLSMQAVTPPAQDPTRFEGAPVYAELTIGGTAANLDVLSSFVGNLEGDARFGVLFQNANRTRDEGDATTFGYSLTVGALDGAAPAGGAEDR